MKCFTEELRDLFEKYNAILASYSVNTVPGNDYLEFNLSGCINKKYMDNSMKLIETEKEQE